MAPSSATVGVRFTRLLLRRLFWLADQIWRVLQPRLGWVILTSVLLGIIVFLSGLLVVPPLLRSLRAETQVDQRVALIQPAPSVVDFLRGQQTYDADLMWESFSPSFREELEQRDFTRERLAEQIESERQAGQRYRKYEYVGGLKLDGNRAMYFYAVEVASPQRESTISFVFTVDANGKIISVE